MRINSYLKEALFYPTNKIINEEFPNTPVIHSHQSGNEPTGTYVVINPIMPEQIGRTQYSTTASDQETIHITTVWETTTQFEFIGKDGADMAFFFDLAMNNVVNWEEFQRKELSFIRKSNVRPAPMLRETMWVERYNLDVTFTFSVTQTQVVDIIEDISFIIDIKKEP